jgi:hypothetical protein
LKKRTYQTRYKYLIISLFEINLHNLTSKKLFYGKLLKQLLYFDRNRNHERLELCMLILYSGKILIIIIKIIIYSYYYYKLKKTKELY